MRIVTTSASSLGGARPKDHDMVATGRSYQARVPRGLRVLSSLSSSSSSSSSSLEPQQELSELQAEAAMLEQWWKEPRWMHTKRIYSRKSVLCVCV